MKIVTLIPFFRESRELTRFCLENVETYADGAVVCVNDTYDKDTEDFLRSFSIVKKVAFVRKDESVCDPVYLSSLLTMAQELKPDWIVRQDIDEAFEPRFCNIRDVMANTPFNLFYVLWVSYVQDETHHCFVHNEIEVGLTKPIIYRFDLQNLFVPSRLVHADLTLSQPVPGIINIRLFHKNMLKSDQENVIKFFGTGRNKVDDPSVRSLEERMPDVIEAGKNQKKETFLKRDRDMETFLPYSFVAEPCADGNIIISKEFGQYTRQDFVRFLSAWYPTQNVKDRLKRERPEIKPAEALRRQAIILAKKSSWLRQLRTKYLMLANRRR